MAVLSKGQTFADGDDVTHTKLNNLVDAATFVAGASGTTDNSTLEVNGSGRLQVKDSGITTGKIGASAVTTTKIANSTSTTDGVTFPKMRYLSDMTVIGNVSGGETTPSEVTILDEDNMASDSDTSLATQQSIKAYIDAQIAATIATTGLGINGETWADVSITSGASRQNSNSYPIYVSVSMTDNDTVEVSNDNATWINLYGPSGDRGPCSFIVPPGLYYRVTGVTTIQVLS